eukprot:4079-Heterococcus_DN1.PRE.9
MHYHHCCCYSILYTTIATTAEHPYHQHVSPVQIVNVSSQYDEVPDWFVVGDWFDTVSQPLATEDASHVVARFRADRYLGKQVNSQRDEAIPPTLQVLKMLQCALQAARSQRSSTQ